MSNHNHTPITKACAIVGSQAEMARLLGIPVAAVSQWVRGVRPVPDKHALAIEKATNGKVTRKQLCPNTWQRYWPELGHTKAQPKEASHA